MWIDDKEIIIRGELIKTISLKEEWDHDIENPSKFINNIKIAGGYADIFTFRQRLPDSKPKHNLYYEWESIAAIPIINYSHWFHKQLHVNPKNKIRLAIKRGVEIKRVDFSDDLINNIIEIYNETPIRQGKRNRQYNIDFQTAKKVNATFLDRAVFLGAFFDSELIGFLKLVDTIKYTRVMGIIGKIAHREKAPINLLIAKAVEICSEKKVPYLTYGSYDYGKLGSESLKDFKRYHGFENIILPRYYIPLTKKGFLSIKMNLHHNLIEILPKKLLDKLKYIRNKWYSKKYGLKFSTWN